MTRKHQHQVTREMLESLIEDFATGLYTDIDREDTGSGGSFRGTGWQRPVDGEVLLTILDNACHAVPPTFRPRAVRDLISAAEAFAVFKATVARMREVEK